MTAVFGVPCKTEPERLLDDLERILREERLIDPVVRVALAELRRRTVDERDDTLQGYIDRGRQPEIEEQIDADKLLMRDRLRRATELLEILGPGPNLAIVQAMNLIMLQDLTEAINRLADRADRRTFRGD